MLIEDNRVQTTEWMFGLVQGCRVLALKTFLYSLVNEEHPSISVDLPYRLYKCQRSSSPDHHFSTA